MKNKAMERKLQNGYAVDVSKCKRDGEGNYILEAYVDGVDYCDSSSDRWIWSIGQHIETGKILASTDGRFYQNPAYKCLWLR